MSNRGPSMILGGIQWGEDRYPVFYYRDGGDRWSYTIHRLTAYAHGIIDHPRAEKEDLIAIDGHADDEVRIEPDPREVHHIDEDILNAHPDNLAALESEHHTIVTHDDPEESEPADGDDGERRCPECEAPLLDRMTECPICDQEIREAPA